MENHSQNTKNVLFGTDIFYVFGKKYNVKKAHIQLIYCG